MTREESTLEALKAQNAALRQVVIVHDRLSALVLQQGADVASITRVFAGLIGRRVLLLDTLLQVVTMAVAERDVHDATMDGAFAWTPGEEYVRAVLGALARERRPLRVPPMPDLGVEASCVLAPVAVGDSLLGYLAILGQHAETGTEDLELQVVQHAATVYALALLRERMAADLARQLRDELFEGLLAGRTQDEQVARERAMRIGYDPEIAYRVLVLAPELADDDDDEHAQHEPAIRARRKRFLEGLADLCTRLAPRGLASVRDDELVVLVPAVDGSPSAAELGRAALTHAASLQPAWCVTAGLGGACETPSAMARSYAQARRALETARRFGRRGEVVAFEDLGLYRLLFHVSEPDELRGFVEQVLGALVEYDERHNADFVRTLGTFLANNGSLQATARELNLHVNSVAYRLQRIRSITGLDLERSEDRLLAQVALKILDARL